LKMNIGFKIRKLKGIANNAIEIDWRDPLKSGLLIPYEIEANLLTRKIKPDPKGDDIEKHFNIVFKWFEEVLEKENIPKEIIDEAKIIAKPGAKQKCIIKTKGKTYSSN